MAKQKKHLFPKGGGAFTCALRHIACAFGANIDLHVYNFPCPLSLALYVRISIADRQISSRFAAYRLRRGRKYRFTQYPLIHRRRDGGPPSPQSSAKPSGRRSVLRWLPTRRRSLFSTKLGKAERAKVGNFQFSIFIFQFIS